MSKTRSNIPEPIKPILRFLRYSNERKKVIREIGIRKQQNRLLKERYDASTRKLIIFGIHGSDWETGKDKVSGGIISIVSLCEESAGLKQMHGASTILCTFQDQHLLVRHTQFDNNTDVFRWEQLADFFTGLEEVILHLPEYMCEYFLEYTREKEMEWLRTRKHFHINILNQNILLMPDSNIIGKLKGLAHKVTCTTAHQNYCSPYYREYFGIPIHKFSAWVSPEQYHFKQWREKENLLIVSPDEHPSKKEILKKLETVPGLTIQIIQNLTYTQFKEVIGRAKWGLTFGEGMDGYIIEPIFSGSIGFAVYNEHFFTPDFAGLKTIYPSYDILEKKIIGDMQILDDEHSYKIYQKEQFDLCASYYSKEQYRKNIAAFYKGEYTFS